MNAGCKSILTVDLDTETSSLLSKALSQEGYFVNSIFSNNETLNHLQHFPNLIILNPNLSGMNGLDILRALKQQPEFSHIPIFILSNRQNEADEIISLEIGADDYITQPVQIPRLKARIRALFRRQDQQMNTQDSDNNVITIDALSIFVQQFSVMCGQDYMEFSKKEFEILLRLAKNHGRVLTRQELFYSIWGQHNNSAKSYNRCAHRPHSKETKRIFTLHRNCVRYWLSVS